MKNKSPKINFLENCKTFKPTAKTFKDEKITLVENNKVVSDESKSVEIFSKYFGNIVQNLGIDGLTNISSDNDPVTIKKHREISKSS